MKTCTKCKQDYEESLFYHDRSNKDGLTYWCKACCNKANKRTYYKYTPARAKTIAKWIAKHHAEMRVFLWDYKLTHPCVDCGESDPRVLQFDHVRGEKVDDVCYLAFAMKWSIDRLLSEIAKCDVRCANCHAKRTYTARGCWIPEGGSK